MSDAEAFGRLAEAGAGVISDAMMRLSLHGWMDGLHPIGGGTRFASNRCVGPTLRNGFLMVRCRG